jgi:tRNA(fMet)-specific endonuclease VapC
MIVLDTDCLSLLDRERSLESTNLRNALDQFDQVEIFTTIITFEEHMRGWLSYIARFRNPEDQIFAYGRLHRFLESYRKTQVLDFDEKSVEKYRELKAQKIRVGTMDMKIAAIAIANNAILISRNLVDFERVPHLTVEDWT